jgi:hypothetical protein
MNKILLPVFIFIIFLAFKSQTFAQEVNIWDFYSNDFYSVYDDSTDKRFQLLNQVDTKYYLFNKKNFFVFEYKNDLNRFIDSTGVTEPIRWDGQGIDFNKNSLVLFKYHGVDCHSRFKFGFGENDDLKTYFIRISILYGGCRAGGRYYETWALIPKLPEGYEVNISRLVIDDMHNQKSRELYEE